MYETPTLTPTLSLSESFDLATERVNRDIAMRATLTPHDHFTVITDRLFTDITRKATNPWFPLEPGQLLLIKIIWHQLRRFRRRFAAIMAQYRAGTLPQPDTAPPPPSRSSPPSRRTRLVYSRHFGWVIHAVSYFVFGRHHEFKQLLDDPATAAEVAEKPQLGSVLRPLCQMLAVRQPRWLRRPRRPRPSRARVIPPAPPEVLNMPGAFTKPDGTVWARFGKSTNWRPGCGETLEEMQKFDYPQRIWPRD